MAYLLDTDNVSATRHKPRDIRLESWLRTLSPAETFISVITIGEIEKGIEKQRTVNSEFADDLSQWLHQLLLHFSDRILPITTPIARRWGKTSQHLGNANADILIAATAIEHGLVVSTRNTRHFKPTGVEVFNPFV